MGPAVEIGVAIALIVVIVAVVLFSLGSRRRMLKCPECGTVFKAPAVDEKVSGLGWTFPYTGRVKCPKCGEKRSRRDYLKAEPQAPVTTTPAS